MTFARHATAVFVALFIALGLTGAGMAQGDRIWDHSERRWVPKPEPIMGQGSPIRREVVDYETSYTPGTIVVDTSERRLYLVLEDGKALKYGVGVGRDGFTWSGTHRITRKAEWPGWTPPPAMRRRQPDLPAYMEGGPMNPLGARALYIGSTLYRLHGTAEPWTIGQAVSSGCIRLTNDDIIDLYNRVEVGALVVVRH
ncbi:L,D-transpeptidase [Pelagibacterium xiamenense]|uniref:L,D-transpeptidase n=1 Tax=Pelagibacterium xiamenense TaxID=2901140 RepID=UPI001E4B3CDC|nr:L,D-transpeptidase [Pelagibacterium xiamenense]MCD7059599.1 L,D-transpeptidase [Pelagibacterium xiamenense]